MALCNDCLKRQKCKAICEAVKKEITGRGKTASLKPKTYPVDFSYIENTHNALNSFQVEVLNTVRSLTSNIRESILDRLLIEEAMEKSLLVKEKMLIELFLDGDKQEEIAKKLEISQPRVNFLLKRVFKKLKNFLLGL